MRYLVILTLFFKVLFALNIDTKMYDEKYRNTYLIELEKKLLDDRKNISRPINILNEENYYFEKIKESANKNIVIDKINTKAITNDTISSIDLLNTIKQFLQNKEKELLLSQLLRDLQNKLSITKRQIENFVKKDKDYALLYQLQFAYFKIQKSNIEKRKNFLEKDLNYNFNLIYNAIEKINLKEEDLIKKKRALSIKKIDVLLKRKAQLEIEYEKIRLEDDEIQLKNISKEIEENNKIYQNELMGFIDLNMVEVLFSLKDLNEEKYIKLSNLIEKDITKLEEQDILKYKNLIVLIEDLAKKKFGNTSIIIAKSSSEVKTLFENTKKFFNGTLFIFNEQAITFFSLFKALALIIIGFFLALLYKKWLKKVSIRWSNMSDMSLKITSNVGYYLIVFITFMIAISSLGIDLTSLSLIAGALSIGIGFGLQTVVSNLIAGIILMFERTIRIGDIIEIDNVLKGTVSDIRIRSTTIKTFDNIDIVIPNSSFIQNNVINWTLEDPSRRLHIPFGVAYGTKIEKVKEVILEELQNSDLNFIKNNEDKKPEIRMEMMNASSVDLELLVWVKSNDKFRPNALKSDFLILIYNALYKHNIEIPFPQMDVHFNKKA